MCTCHPTASPRSKPAGSLGTNTSRLLQAQTAATCHPAPPSRTPSPPWIWNRSSAGSPSATFRRHLRPRHQRPNNYLCVSTCSHPPLNPLLCCSSLAPGASPAPHPLMILQPRSTEPLTKFSRLHTPAMETKRSPRECDQHWKNVSRLTSLPARPWVPAGANFPQTTKNALLICLAN